jgi:hypothetical protein
MAKFYEMCPAPGCPKRGSFCRGFCSSHYLEFRKACKVNGSWGSGTPLTHPIVIEKFEWQGDEDALATMCEEQERLRAIKETQQDLKSKEI